MQRDERVGVAGEAEACRHVAGDRRRPVSLEAVDHRVADEHDVVAGDALAGEVVDGVGRRHEQQVGDRVGDETVDLFGHLPVAAAQARLDVRHRQVELGGRRPPRRGSS